MGREISFFNRTDSEPVQPIEGTAAVEGRTFSYQRYGKGVYNQSLDFGVFLFIQRIIINKQIPKTAQTVSPGTRSDDPLPGFSIMATINRNDKPKIIKKATKQPF